MRTANSDSRLSARPSRRPAAFTQPISATRPTADNSAISAKRVPRTTYSCSEVTTMPGVE
jgi:hypothetical protein